MIHKCVCKHEYQDRKYGPQNRVFNSMKQPGHYRCSVCKREINVLGERNIPKLTTKG